MASSRSPVPRQTTAGERTALLVTKLHVPVLRPDLLPRTRLIDRLNSAAACDLVLVSTPAGFGKTTLLAEWAGRDRRPVAWLSLDAGDNDPARFWRYVAGAIDRIRPGAGDGLRSLLDAPVEPTLEEVVAGLVNELVTDPHEFWLVLDDYHVVGSRHVQDSLALLLRRLPPGMHVVIATRTDPPLPLARLRGRGQLAELRAADLRFTPDEVDAVVREVWGLDLPAESLAGLAARTEGWVTALQMAALSLRDAGDPAALVEKFTGTHRYVLDYLTEEVLGRQPEDVQTFLLDTSILDRLTGPLCDAVTGRGDGQRMLRYLESANLFLVPLDEERRWYRYHHLFADLLRARPPADPGRVPQLHRRAAGWAEHHGLVEDAVRHALAAGEDDRAAGLAERYADEHLRRGERTTLRRWVSVLPRQAVAAHPKLCLIEALAAADAGQLTAAEQLLRDAERALATGPARPDQAPAGLDGGALANSPAAIALLRASIAAFRGDGASVTDLVHQAQAHLAENEPGPQFSCRWNLGLAAWTDGRLGEAERVFADITTEGWATGLVHLALNAGSVLGQVQQAQGQLTDALRSYRKVLELSGPAGHSASVAAGTAHAGIADVLYQRDQLDEALRHGSAAVALSRQLSPTRMLAAALVSLARIRWARGDAAGAWELIDEAVRTFPSQEIVALHNPVPTERVRLLLALGNVTEAARRVAEWGLTSDDTGDYSRERQYLAQARLLLVRDAPDQALDVLERLRVNAAAQQRTGSVIEIGALQTLALHAAGRQAAALSALTEILARSRAEGYVRVFADEGPPMAALLRRLAATGRRGSQSGPAVPVEHLGNLLQALKADQRNRQPDAKLVPAGTPGMVDVLTEREVEVLALLAVGKQNREIAEELVVTLDTVKKHVTHILAKLGAANRTQAVARARDLTLIR
jgi:LuxR family maltose regulon positive regulatory protein